MLSVDKDSAPTYWPKPKGFRRNLVITTTLLFLVKNSENDIQTERIDMERIENHLTFTLVLQNDKEFFADVTVINTEILLLNELMLIITDS